jgi:NAD(P)-dependent dehydrogenase (short-subunit alcohol dehydrogenase family)
VQDTPSIAPGLHAPPGEPLPLVVWTVAPSARLVHRLHALGAYVMASGRSESEAWPHALAEAVEDCRYRFGRAYVVRCRVSAVPRVAAGLRGTPVHDADPWSVALLVGAARDAGCTVELHPARAGGGTSDALQGFELALPNDADDALVTAAGALADGLRIAQLKC